MMGSLVVRSAQSGIELTLVIVDPQKHTSFQPAKVMASSPIENGGMVDGDFGVSPTAQGRAD
jgi:hypothetical protein